MILKALVVSLFVLGTTGMDDTEGPDAIENFSQEDARKYLEKYDFFNSEIVLFSVGNVLSESIGKFQESAGLQITNELDDNTIEAMVAPRCGVLEAANQGDGITPKWNKKTLTYRINEYSRKLSNREVDSTIRKAMDFWEGAADLTFVKTSGRADIEIRFGTWEHGDGLEFDGKGGVLAHAYYPSSSEIAGDAHFDDDEPWSVRDNIGKQFLQTCTHELGHSLGLSHSRVKGSVMYFSYPGWDPYLRLHSDDIQRIQKLYGKPPSTPTPTPRTRTPPRRAGPCECASYTRWDEGSSQSIGNCKTEYQSKKWCYIKPGANCPDKKKSSFNNREWSWEACLVNEDSDPFGLDEECQCNGKTRYDSGRDKTVGYCQTEYRGNFWCYISSDSYCKDKLGTRRKTDGFRYWSALACELTTPFQRETKEKKYVPLYFPGQDIPATAAPGTP